MTCLGNQLIRLVALESHQNGNGVILGFLSKECVRHQGRSHIVAWGGRGPCKKKKKFPLDYEEKIIRPPQP